MRPSSGTASVMQYAAPSASVWVACGMSAMAWHVRPRHVEAEVAAEPLVLKAVSNLDKSPFKIRVPGNREALACKYAGNGGGF